MRKVCLHLRDMGAELAIKMEDLEETLKNETEGRQAIEECVAWERLGEKEEWQKALTLEKLSRLEGLARWKGNMMNELDLEREFWKRKVGELQVELEIEKQKVKREAEKVASSVAEAVA